MTMVDVIFQNITVKLPMCVYARIGDCNKNISSHLRSLNDSINSEQTQISKSTLILSCARVFISPELIKAAKMCRLHRDHIGIYGNPVPSNANTRFMEMTNEKLTTGVRYYCLGRPTIHGMIAYQ